MTDHTTHRYPGKTLEEKFWIYTASGRFTECWLWHGPTDSDEGYGRLYIARHKFIYAHRLSYQIHNGPFPNELDILHTCDVNYPVGDVTYRLCVNPYHLYAGTHTENMADMKNRRRYVVPALKGEASPMSKLTEADVLQIRALAESGVSQRDIASRFGVQRQAVSKIVNRHRWRHI